MLTRVYRDSYQSTRKFSMVYVPHRGKLGPGSLV